MWLRYVLNADRFFTHSAKPLLDGIMDGFNATVFAYGVK